MDSKKGLEMDSKKGLEMDSKKGLEMDSKNLGFEEVFIYDNYKIILLMY